MNNNETPKSALDRFLRMFSDVRSGEGVIALLLALNVFLILMAYYILKPAREALILGEGSPELKSYMSAGQVLLLAVIVPYYGKLVKRFARMPLINLVTLFFVACLVLFFALGKVGVPLAIPFFLWIGIFNLMVIAQFWSFANDIYTKDEGERLFPIVGFGASLGAVFGATFASQWIEQLGVWGLMLVGAVVLGAQLLLTNYVDRRKGTRQVDSTAAKPLAAKDGPSGGNAFAMVFGNRYLLLIALMLMLLNFVNTTGEYILGSVVTESVQRAAAAGSISGPEVQETIGKFYARYFLAVNVLGVLMQLFVVSRVVKYLGVGWAVMILPIISLTSYNVLAFLPVLSAVFIAKVAENATDYSLNNTVRNMLFLPCTREEKYSAKQAIDSFFVRMGDVLAAGLVFVGTYYLTLQPRGFAALNAGIVVIWLLIAWRVGRYYRTMTASVSPGATNGRAPQAIVDPQATGEPRAAAGTPLSAT
jgi:ATP:ADP antiporter, AAA family